jgi:hypothetical protein
MFNTKTQNERNSMNITYEIREQGSWFICLIKESGKLHPISYKPEWFPTKKCAVAFGELIKFRYSK